MSAAMVLDPDFALDPRLREDTGFVADLTLSRVLLMDDRRYLWAVLVPRRSDAVEWIDLSPPDQAALWAETARVGTALRRLGPCEKINIGALGNIVRQLHVHVVARRTDDAAWPGPVWGAGTRIPCHPDERAAIAARLAAELG